MEEDDPEPIFDNFTFALIIAVIMVLFLLYLVMHICIYRYILFLRFVLLLKKIKLLFLFVVISKNNISYMCVFENTVSFLKFKICN